MQCAEQNYDHLLNLAENYLENLDQNRIESSELKELKKPAGENKAKISIIASILKPGKSIQISVQDNNWINEKTLILPNIILIREFIANLLNFT